MRSILRRAFAIAGVLLAILLGAGAGPASAHTVGGSGATDFVTTLDSLSPAVPGLSLTVVENGTKLEIVNRSGEDVIVDGYVGDQYLKIGPDGAFVNTQSPATYLNNDRWGKTTVPPGVDPAAPPVWKKTSAEPVFRWHDHRIHWMSTTLPPAVKAAPGKAHPISTWTVTMHRGGRLLTATGHLNWVPGPSKVVWLGVVLVAFLGAVVLCGSRNVRRARLWTGGVTLGLVCLDVAHSIWVAADTAGSAGAQVGRFFGGNVVQLAASAEHYAPQSRAALPSLERGLSETDPEQGPEPPTRRRFIAFLFSH